MESEVKEFIKQYWAKAKWFILVAMAGYTIFFALIEDRSIDYNVLSNIQGLAISAAAISVGLLLWQIALTIYSKLQPGLARKSNLKKLSQTEEQLHRCISLHKEGLITDEQLEKKKKELLESIL